MLPFKYCLCFHLASLFVWVLPCLEEGSWIFFLAGGDSYCMFSFFSPGNRDETRKKKTFKSIFSLGHWARMTKAPLEQLEETWGDGECFKRMKAATENPASSDNRCFLFFHYLERNILHLGKSALTARPDFKNKTMKRGREKEEGEGESKTTKKKDFFSQSKMHGRGRAHIVWRECFTPRDALLRQLSVCRRHL